MSLDTSALGFRRLRFWLGVVRRYCEWEGVGGWRGGVEDGGGFCGLSLGSLYPGVAAYTSAGFSDLACFATLALGRATVFVSFDPPAFGSLGICIVRNGGIGYPWPSCRSTRWRSNPLAFISFDTPVLGLRLFDESAFRSLGPRTAVASLYLFSVT
jgi:hypothetical protein